MKYFILLLWFSVIFWNINAGALPKFSLREKKRCYHCHFNQNGGGPLNSLGKYYSQNRSFEGYREGIVKFAAKEKVAVVTKKEIKPEKTKIVETSREIISKEETTLFERTTLGADIVLSFLINEERVAPQNFFLMKAEPLVTTQVTDHFLTVFGYNLAAPFLTAYGQYTWDPHYIQIGSFRIPFGLDFLDYNNVAATLIKEQYDLGLDTRDVGIEIGARRDFYGRVAIVNGAREPRERPTLRPTFDRDLGYVFDLGYQGIFYEIPFLLGASFLSERRIPPGEPIKGIPSNPPLGKRSVTHIIDLYGQLGYKDFSLLGEFTFGRNTPHRTDRSYGFYVKSSYNIYPYWIVSIRGELFALDRRFLEDNRMRFVVATEYYFSKYIFLEPMYRMNVELGNVPQTRNNEFIALLNMKF